MILAVFIALVLLFIVIPLIWHVFWVVFWAAIFGIFFGALGRLVVPGRQNIGVLPTIVCGMIGSLVGGLIGHALGGWFVTLLCEIGVSAGAVAFWSTTHRTPVSGRRRMLGRRI